MGCTKCLNTLYGENEPRVLTHTQPVDWGLNSCDVLLYLNTVQNTVWLKERRKERRKERDVPRGRTAIRLTSSFLSLSALIQRVRSKVGRARMMRWRISWFCFVILFIDCLG